MTRNDEHKDSSAADIFEELVQQEAQQSASMPEQPEQPETSDVQPLPEAAPLDARRVRRRHSSQHAGNAVSTFFGAGFVVLLSAALVATLLLFFVDPAALNPAVLQGMQGGDGRQFAAAAPQNANPLRTPQWLQRIGIISGHSGPGPSGLPDSGAICSDESGRAFLREADINHAVATRVVDSLKAMGYQVDLLDETDPRLTNYRADALVSIHANTCYDFGETISGYIVAISKARPETGTDAFLRECIAENYGRTVPLARSFNVTEDMTEYHVWRRIHPLTPGMILEMGYMLADRAVLTEDPARLANAIVTGIMCFMDNRDIPSGIVPTVPPERDYIVPNWATPTPIFTR